MTDHLLSQIPETRPDEREPTGFLKLSRSARSSFTIHPDHRHLEAGPFRRGSCLRAAATFATRTANTPASSGGIGVPTSCCGHCISRRGDLLGRLRYAVALNGGIRDRAPAPCMHRLQRSASNVAIRAIPA